MEDDRAPDVGLEHEAFVRGLFVGSETAIAECLEDMALETGGIIGIRFKTDYGRMEWAVCPSQMIPTGRPGWWLLDPEVERERLIERFNERYFQDEPEAASDVWTDFFDREWKGLKGIIEEWVTTPFFGGK